MTSRCEQCGRDGTREFTTIGGFWAPSANAFDPTREDVWVPFITICANREACRKRWPVETEDAREARLA